MMFRFNSKITDNCLLIFILFLVLIINQEISCAETYTQSLTIENIHDSNQDKYKVETDYKNTIFEEDKNKSTNNKSEPERIIVIYDTPLSNPYINNRYNREIIYTIQAPPYSGRRNVTAFSYNNKGLKYKGSSFNYNKNSYNYKGGLYYGQKGSVNVLPPEGQNKKDD